MTSEQNYLGYEELTSYLTRSRDKSFWGFLRRCRDTIVATTQATSRRQDLEGDWVGNFLLEARKLGEDLEGKVNSERQRVKNKLETYWNNIIEECKIKKDILDHEAEISRLQRKLSEIQENTKMQNSSNREMDVDSVNEDDDFLQDNNGGTSYDALYEDIGDNDNGNDNNNNDNDNDINNNNNTTISSSSSPAIATTTPPPYNLRTRRPNPPSYNCGRVTKKYRKKNTPLSQPRPSRQPSRQPSPQRLSPRQLSPRQPSPRRPSPRSSSRQPSPPHDDFDFFDNGSGGEDDNNKCTGGCPEHCGDAYRGDD